MPELLTNILTSDDYTDVATIGPATNVEQLTFQAANQPIFARLFKPIPNQQGEPILEAVERYFPANALVQFSNVCGARFRSAIAGKPSTIVAELAFKTDPISAYSATGLVSPSPTLPAVTRQIFNVAGSFGYVPPVGCTTILVEVIGGGGTGGGAIVGSAGQVAVGGGAGGGGYSASILLVANLSAPMIVVVGAAGSSGSGGVGFNSSFSDNGGTVVDASGGQPGSGMGASVAAPITTAGGAGGSGLHGDLKVNGGAGSSGIAVSASAAGDGGAGGGGGVYGAEGQSAHSVASNGLAGTPNGGGGGGGVRTSSTGSESGGAGAPGLVVVTEFYG